MDLRTGRIYESREAARAAGVPASDLIAVDRDRDGRVRLSSVAVTQLYGTTQQPHQGTREKARRRKRLAQQGR